MCKISVVVPVYNAEKIIERCVKSIVSNDYKDLEVILIDDCSKDNSYEICKKLSDEYTNVRCLHNEENQGVSYTRNRGIYEAEGQYTMFVDSDDWIDKDFFSSFDEVIDKYDSVLPICGYVNHDEKYNGRTDNVVWSDKKQNTCLNLREELKNIYNRTLLQQLWNKAFVTEIIQKNKLSFDETISIGEDLRFILEYIKVSRIYSVVFINKPIYHYMRDQKDSLMYQVGFESIEEPLKNLRVLYELVGYDHQQIEKYLNEDRKKQVSLYAYLIMHNAGMKTKEKKKLILALDSTKGKDLYKYTKSIYYKEKLSKLLKK